MIEINDNQLAYYAQRIEEARFAAEQATSDAAREVHLKIAERYEQQLEAIRSKN